MAACSVSQFYATYKTPFDRVKEDLETNYNLPNAAQAVFNVIIQAQKHYIGFCTILKVAVDNELSFIAEHTEHNEHVLLSYNNFLAQNIGGLFVKSLKVFQNDRVLQS